MNTARPSAENKGKSEKAKGKTSWDRFAMQHNDSKELLEQLDNYLEKSSSSWDLV